MYILFYPLQFPSIPVLILLKFCNTTVIFLWPRTGVEPAFTLRHREYLQTCAYSCIQPSAVRDTVVPHCQITLITHLPNFFGATLPFCPPGHIFLSGWQDSNLRPSGRSVYKIRTYDTSLIIQTHQFLSYWLTVTKPDALPTALHPDKLLFSIILRHSCPENSFRLLSRRTDYRRSPLVCTLPLWNSICLITCLSTLTPVRFHIVLGCLVPWILTLGDNTRALLVLHISPWCWSVLNQCHLLIHLFCLGSG